MSKKNLLTTKLKAILRDIKTNHKVLDSIDL